MPTEEEKRRVRERAEELYREEQARRQREEQQPRRVRQSSTAVSLVLGLLIGLLVGYYIGREHVKSEIRQELAQAHDRFQQNLRQALNPPEPPVQARADPPAETPAVKEEPSQPTPPPSRKCLELGDFGSRQLDINNTYAEMAWRVEITNNCDQPQLVRVTFRFLDKQEYLLDQDVSVAAIPAGEKVVVSDKTLLSPPDKASQIGRFAVSIAVP